MDREGEKQLLLSGEKRSYCGISSKDYPSQMFTYISDLNGIELGHQVNQHCHSQRGQEEWNNKEKVKARRKLYIASVVCLVFMTGEVVGGYMAHSLAIMTDAAHLLTDFASMMISLFALWMSSRPATKTMNFGWHRAEIWEPFSLFSQSGWCTGFGLPAVERLVSGDYEIEGNAMLITSACAVLSIS
ncbi:hypothetical protein GDO86_020234 [Hymenochirus boettgeri]|uniref:Cation efflux protein transmembrane domain-containing protein n=1 Tax=Hymenochirus boettgeri TaxID=247094 RepID=A0A8T2IHJ7_9PIPI|nr:hypothetical protein GDO86_020234 [Hymenochirus boettgeri]